MRRCRPAAALSWLFVEEKPGAEEMPADKPRRWPAGRSLCDNRASEYRCRCPLTTHNRPSGIKRRFSKTGIHPDSIVTDDLASYGGHTRSMLLTAFVHRLQEYGGP